MATSQECEKEQSDDFELGTRRGSAQKALKCLKNGDENDGKKADFSRDLTRIGFCLEIYREGNPTLFCRKSPFKDLDFQLLVIYSLNKNRILSRKV